jgi:hypothetical protein
MKPNLMLPVVAVGLVLTGCDVPTPSLLSLEPAVTGQEAPPDTLLAGAWESSEGDEVCLVRKGKDNAFHILFLSGNSPLAFEGRLFRAGDARILDLEPQGDDHFRVTGHAFARVWVEGNTLRWAFLDSDWLKEQLAAFPNRTADGKTVLLAPGPVVRAFVEKVGADERACSAQVAWQRMQ